VNELPSLLGDLEGATDCSFALAPVLADDIDNELIQVRLGIAHSLHAALCSKHPHAAAHGLRVALSCSAWAHVMELVGDERNALEVAALLHDVGIIGVPDRILHKSGPLDHDEAEIMGRARSWTTRILSSACASRDVLEIVENVGAWYDGTRSGFRLVGDQIPRGARMLGIVEAFDAMTTDHVFRRAMCRETALSELFAFAGTQFDPELVKRFVELDCCDGPEVRREVASRWLRSVDTFDSNSFWKLNAPVGETGQSGEGHMFHRRLMDNMHDAVIFVDADLRIVRWNHGAERLTGIPGNIVCKRQWVPALLEMRNEKGDPVTEDDCPVTCVVESGVQSLRRLTISGRSGRLVSVDNHTIPVVADDGTILGAILILHDASPEASLEKRCETLHEKATLDPLTQVANRAEFDRVHASFVAQHKERTDPFSLMICDLDRFKQVNDNYGHQAGDDAIKSLATLLKNCCRPGDLVARYGGEEFVMLCVNCDNATATDRAEQIRKALSQMPQPKLDGRPVTASFGVTEIQPGDTAETMLRRADRALLMAKNRGRNAVVQLGSGSRVDVSPQHEKRKRPRKRRAEKRSHLKLEQELITPVPIQLAIEKLRGFIADHQAKVIAIDGNHVKLQIDDGSGMLRRRNDRPMTFLVDLQLEEEQVEKPRKETPGSTQIPQTKIRVSVVPRKSRDRRRADVTGRAREVLASFRSYLMANIASESTTKLQIARSFLFPWLTKG
jgi:diguanylate cyclase (GGDEF)-like protein/PAS domain S-box-containing protein